jgi:YidC/Oxa1 family membrane protein insertase
MGAIMDIINIPIGWLMRFLYQFVGNYGVAVILLAVITKLLMVPLGIKQHKGQLSQMKFRKRIARIQKKYAGDQARMQQEMQKLQAEGYSPTAGCGTMLIQFPVLIGIYNVIRYPLQYVVGLNSDIINKLLELYNNATGAALANTAPEYQITLIEHIGQNFATYETVLADTNYFAINLDFLGMNLAAIPAKLEYFLQSIVPIPTFDASFLWLIPILSAITAAASTILSQKMGPSKYMQDPNMQGKGTMAFMNVLGPYMSYAIAFSVPAGLGLYWVFSNILMTLQTVALNLIYNPAKYKEMYDKEEEERKLKKKKKRELAAKLAAEEAAKANAAIEAASEKENQDD